MKTLKLLVFLFLCGNFSLYSQEYNKNKEIQLENRTIKTKDETGSTSEEGTPTKRSILLQPAYAYIYNNVVSINFSEAFSTVIISISNKATGEVVYSETCSVPTNLSINLNGESSGSYLIDIETDATHLEGSFSL